MIDINRLSNLKKNNTYSKKNNYLIKTVDKIPKSPNIINNRFKSSNRNRRLIRLTSIKPLKYEYFINTGHNSKLILNVISKRKNWREVSNNIKTPNLLFYQINNPIIWEKIKNNNKTIINHYEYSREIGRKDLLPKNLKKYYLKKNKNLFNIFPPTIEVIIDPKNNDTDINNFIQIFNKFDSYKSYKNPPFIDLSDIFSNFNKKELLLETKYFGGFEKVSKNYYNGKNIWLVKPHNLNRGNGIELFSSVNEFKSLYNKIISNNNFSDKRNSSKIIIQKYLENPLLINNRKFDIRVWAMVGINMEVYLSKEGYIRTSSFEHNMDNNLKNNKQSFLTNISIQKLNKDSYSKYEEGNILSYAYLERYLKTINANFTLNDIKKQIAKIARDIFLSVKQKININNRKYCYEIYGIDYIVDNDGKVWLLEINVNPSMSLNCGIVNNLFPRLIDDCFKLTIDKLFPTTLSNINYQVDDYDNNTNLWECIIKKLKNN